MSLTLNHFIIIKFHVAGTEIILIRRAGYSEHCLNIEVGDVYKINIHVPACLNRAGIAEILNVYQKFSVLKEDGMIVCDAMGSIIYNI